MPKQRTANLVWCLAIGWCFVAPKTAWGKARRGSIAAALCDRGATKPQAVFGATLRAAVLFASRFVARSSQTAEGYACRSRLAGDENSLRRNTSQLRDTTLAASRNCNPLVTDRSLCEHWGHGNENPRDAEDSCGGRRAGCGRVDRLQPQGRRLRRRRHGRRRQRSPEKGAVFAAGFDRAR